MKPFTNECLYDHPLTADSVVLDVGGYEGGFALEIHRRHRCFVNIFEPCAIYHHALFDRLKDDWHFIVHPYGLGGYQRKDTIRIKGSMTGLFADDGPQEEILIVDVYEYVPPHVDLLALNCEGAEFEILERILKCGIAKEFKAIQVQFHPVVPDCERRYAAIREGLLKTHHLTFDDGWTWQGWELNP